MFYLMCCRVVELPATDGSFAERCPTTPHNVRGKLPYLVPAMPLLRLRGDEPLSILVSSLSSLSVNEQTVPLDDVMCLFWWCVLKHFFGKHFTHKSKILTVTELLVCLHRLEPEPQWLPLPSVGQPHLNSMWAVRRGFCSSLTQRACLSQYFSTPQVSWHV